MNSSNPRFAVAGNKLEGAVETGKQKAEGVTAAVTETAQAVKDNVKELASSAADMTEKAWDSTRETVGEWGGQVAHRAETAYADAVIFVRRNPIASVSGALGIGLLIGLAVSAGLGATRN